MILTGAKIQAIGDSITYGFGDAQVISEGAWRYYLADQLAGYIRSNLIWVGTMQALGSDKAGKRMLGTTGRRIDEVITIDNAASNLLLTSPNLAIIHLGTNDMTQINSGAWVGGSVAVSVANLSTLLDNIRTANSNCIVVVCKIMPNQTAGADTLITQWCSSMATMIAARSDVSKIIIADVNTAFKNNASWAVDYMYDSTHPNVLGESIIANTIYSAIQSNIVIKQRFQSQLRNTIKPFTNSLSYTASVSTGLGSGVTLDSTLPWAVSFDIDISRSVGSTSSANGILSLKTDQATPFVFCTLPTTGGGGRGIELGSSANFLRMFPANTVNANVYNMFRYGWHNFTVTFDGVSRATLSSYKFYLDGTNITLSSGSGLGVTANVNEIGRAIAGGTAGTFSMANLKIWNGGSAMTAMQVADLVFGNKLPSGPTLTRNYQHGDGSGSTLTDSTGNQNGTIGTATWSNVNLPNKLRTSASSRSIASARSLAV